MFCSGFLSLPWGLKEMKPGPSPSFQQSWKRRGFGKRAVYQNATWLIASRGGLLFSIFFAIVCFKQLATFWFAGQFGVPEILASPETEFSSGRLGMLHMYPLPCKFFRGAGPPKRDSSSRIWAFRAPCQLKHGRWVSQSIFLAPVGEPVNTFLLLYFGDYRFSGRICLFGRDRKVCPARICIFVCWLRGGCHVPCRQVAHPMAPAGLLPPGGGTLQAGKHARAALAASIFWMVWVPKKRQQTLFGWMVWGSKAADPFLDGVLRGVDTDDFLFIQPDNGEQAESVDTFVRSSAVDLRGNQTETGSPFCWETPMWLVNFNSLLNSGWWTLNPHNDVHLFLWFWRKRKKEKRHFGGP